MVEATCKSSVRDERQAQQRQRALLLGQLKTRMPNYQKQQVIGSDGPLWGHGVLIASAADVEQFDGYASRLVR